MGHENSELVSSVSDNQSALPERRRVLTSTYDLAIDSIISRICGGSLHLRQISSRPKFQRNYVWSDEKASKLIESILLNVPLPVVYFSEDSDYNFDVIDGQQRIYSIYRFLKDEFELSDLDEYHEIEGKKYSELPDQTKKQIQFHVIRCIVIRNESHPQIKFDVFARLNSNSTPLTAQEIRNCIYEGKFNDMLGELASSEKWLSIRKRKRPDKRLGDEELILRFFSFILQDRDDYDTPLKNWLNKAAFIGSNISDKELINYRNKWENSLIVSLEWFEPTKCFRRLDSNRFNKSLFDLISYSAAKLDLESASKIKLEFIKRYRNLLKQEKFLDLLDSSVDTKSRTFERIKMWNSEMSGLGL